MIRYTDIEHRATQAVQRPWLCMAVFAAAIVAAFFPTFGNLLQEGWDDQWQVVNHYTTSGFTWKNLCAIFTEVYGTQYSPIDQCMYTLLYLIDGYNPAVYHAASLLLHFANTCLVYTLLRRILQDTTHLVAARTAWIAFLTAMLFAIHPIQVEAVAWVSASKIPLYTLFYLLSTWMFVAFLTTSNKDGNKYLQKTKDANNTNEREISAVQPPLSTVRCQLPAVKWYVLTLFFFLCAFGCKEQVVILPFWLALLSYCYRRNLKAVVWHTLPLLAVSVGLGLLFIFCISAYANVKPGTMVAEYSWWQRTVFSLYSLVEYLFKWCIPYRLNHLYPFPMEMGGSLPMWMIVYPMVFAVAVCTLWHYLRHWAVLAGGAFFLLNIALVLHLFPLIRPNMMADRYMYLSSAGLAFIVAYFFTGAFVRWGTLWRKTAGVVAAGVLIILGLYSHQRTKVWYDTETLIREQNVLAPDTTDTSKKVLAATPNEVSATTYNKMPQGGLCFSNYLLLIKI